MTLLGVLLASSASAFSLLGPLKTNAPPATPMEAYLDGYREGYSLGYHGCGPYRVEYQGKFAEAFIRGQQRGLTNGWEDSEAESRERQVGLEQERILTRKAVWHPPLLPPPNADATSTVLGSQILLPSLWPIHSGDIK